MINFEKSRYTKTARGRVSKNNRSNRVDVVKNGHNPSIKAGEMRKIMVYGTLRKGCSNHRLLANSEMLGEYTVPGYEMYSAGGFPYCIPVDNMNSQITAEVYLVNSNTLEQLDLLEGVAYSHYMRVPVNRSEFEDVEIYVPCDKTVINRIPKINSGNWKKSAYGYEDDDEYFYNRNFYY